MLKHITSSCFHDFHERQIFCLGDRVKQSPQGSVVVLAIRARAQLHSQVLSALIAVFPLELQGLRPAVAAGTQWQGHMVQGEAGSLADRW